MMQWSEHTGVLISPDYWGFTAYENKALHKILRNYDDEFLNSSQSISPGGVKTEIGEASGFPKEMLELYKDNPILESKDIADSVMYVLGTPPHVQVRVWILITNSSGSCKMLPPLRFWVWVWRLKTGLFSYTLIPYYINRNG
jgi:hypothetical protein